MTFVRHVLSQLVNGHLLLLVAECGTVFQTISLLPYHCQPFIEKSTYFSCHIRKLFLDFVLLFVG